MYKTVKDLGGVTNVHVFSNVSHWIGPIASYNPNAKVSLQWFNELLNYWLTIWLYSNILLLQHTPSNYAGVTHTWPTVMDKGTPIVANIIAPLRPRKHPQSHYHVTIKSIVKYVLRKRLIYCSLWMVPCTRNISQCFIASDVAYLLLLLITSTTSKRVTYCYVTFHICIWQQTYG